MKKLLMMSGAIVALSAASAVAAVDVDVSAKVQFTATLGDTLGDNPTGVADNANVAATVPAYSNDASTSIEKWDTDADLTFTASKDTCCLDFGIRVNLDIDPDAGTVSDTDAKLYVNTEYGRLEFGEVDASQGTFDQSFMDVGPLSGGKNVSQPFVSASAALSDNDHKFDPEIPTSGIALFAPVGPLSFAASVDAADNLVASVKGSYDLLGYGISGAAAVAGDTYAAKLQTSIMGIKIGGTIGEDDDDEAYYGGGLGYDMGALSFSGTAMESGGKARLTAGPVIYDAKERDLTFGVDYNLGSGLVVDGSVQVSKRVTSATPVVAAATSDNSWTSVGLRIAASF